MTESVNLHIKELKEQKEQAWGAYLILTDEAEDWYLPIGLRPSIAAVVKAQLAGRDDSAVPALMERVLGFVQGRLVRVTIEGNDSGTISGAAVVNQDGTERSLPLRVHDGALLARRSGVPLTVTAEALHRSGIRKDETLDGLVPADQEQLTRFTMGCLALERLDEGIAACERLIGIVGEDTRDIWRVWLGDFCRLKGWRRRAAEEYAAGIAWEIRFGDYSGAIRIAEKMGAIGSVEAGPARFKAPALIEDFEVNWAYNVWSSWKLGTNVPAPERPAGKVRRFEYDLAAYEYPWVHIGLDGTHIWEGAKAISFEVYFDPRTGADVLPVELGLDLGGRREGKWVAEPVEIRRGWNRHVIPLNKPVWTVDHVTQTALDDDPLEPVVGVQFILQGGGKQGTGIVSFTNIRIE